MESYDVIVLGLGAMGSSALRYAAKRGLNVLGIEQFPDVPHNRGSHHGHTRIIRQAYFEDPAYVPFILRAYELWQELEADAGQTLFVKTGGLTVGPPDNEMVEGVIRSARLHQLPYQQMTRQETTAHFPQFRLASEDIAVFEPDAGYLLSELAVRATFQNAVHHGAKTMLSTKVIGVKSVGNGVEVTTSQGTVYGDQVILTVGAWAPDFMGNIPLQVERNIVFWFQPESGSLRSIPVFLADANQSTIYGFPDIEGHGFKVGFHHSGETTTAETINREVSPEEVTVMRETAARLLPDMRDAALIQASVCMYTNTTDYNFIIGRHPSEDGVVIGLGFSGHGFKFASAVGELLVKIARQDNGVEIPEIFNPRRTF